MSRLHLPSVLLIATILAGCSSKQYPDPRGQGIAAAFKQADADGDERLTPQEFAQLPLQGVKFSDVDSDDNGVVTLPELRSYLDWRRLTMQVPINSESSTDRRGDDPGP